MIPYWDRHGYFDTSVTPPMYRVRLRWWMWAFPSYWRARWHARDAA